MTRFGTAATVAGLMMALAGSASASIIQVSESSFVAGSGLITFSEFPVGTMNPVYRPGVYGGGAGSPTVTFGGFFSGQSAGSTNPSACPAGAMVSGCVLGNPSGPLSIAPNSPATFITDDASMPTSPVLSGTPLFNGSIAILLSTPQFGVGLTGGYFDALNSAAITASAASGNLIGSVTNSQLGNQFLGLVTGDGSATISGLLFSLVGPEPAGFNVDNIRFGTQGQVIVNPVLEPVSLAILGTSLLGLGLLRRRKAV